MSAVHLAQAAQQSVLIGLYLLLNSVLNLANRYLLGLYGFRYPFLLTMSHLAFAFVALFIPLSRRGASTSVWKKNWRGLAATGACMAANIGCNNLSLVRLPLALNQTLRASLPVVTALVAVFVESKRPSRHETWSLVLLTAGVCLTVFEGKSAGNTMGLVLAAAGVLSAAAMMCTAGMLLHDQLDPMQLTFYTAPVSMAVLFPFFLTRELDSFKLYLQESGGGAAVWVMLACSSAVALAYNLVHYLLLQRTSSITVTVLGEVKIVGLLVLSALILPGESSELSARTVLGMVTAVLGFCMYSNVKLWASNAKPDAKVRPKDSMKDEERAQLLAHGNEGEVVGHAKEQRQRHRNSCMYALSGLAAASRSSPPAAVTLHERHISMASQGLRDPQLLPASAPASPGPSCRNSALDLPLLATQQLSTSQPVLPHLAAAMAAKGPQVAGTDGVCLEPLRVTSIDGPDTPPSQPPSGKLIRSRSMGNSESSAGSPEEALPLSFLGHSDDGSLRHLVNGLESPARRARGAQVW